MNGHLTLNELEVFLQIAETRSFRLAAERMHVSQPALSRTLQSAEWKLSARLFDRNTRRVELSSAGHELLPIAKRVLSEFRGSLSDLSEFIAGRRGRVVVASLPSAAAALLPSAIAHFSTTHPQVLIELQPSPAEKVQDLVREGHADFALSIRPTDEREVHYEPLIRDDFVLICPVGHELASSRSANWAEFAQHPYIASGAVTSVRHIADRVLSESGIAISPRYESSNLAVLGAMVAAGLGISAVPKLALRLIDATQLVVVPLRKPVAHRELGLLTRSSRSLPAAATRFIEVLRQQSRALVDSRSV
jgi:LysR family carnitine catabolism transcriptional activator